jgi:hypothetical protein
MARLRSLVAGTQSVKVHPTEVDCFYQTVLDNNGKTILHLTTFGSDGRQSNPKSSQSIQLDERSARALVRIIEETFDIGG